MAKKIGILDVHQADDGQPQTYVKKSVAHLLVRRLLAAWVIENVLIRRLTIEQPRELPRNFEQCRRKKFEVYEHHLEPRIEQLTFGNSEWIQYLHGYR